VWISLLRSPLFEQTDLSSLRKGYYGASIMPVEVLREMARRLPDVGFWNPVRPDRDRAAGDHARPRGPAAQAGLLRPRRAERGNARGRRRPAGRAAGEVGRDRAPLAAPDARLLPRRRAHRAAFEGGWFHSGDLATIDDEGYITVVDRKKDMIKTGGENVASREVEEMIYRLPQVSEVAVVGVPHPRWVEAVVAVVVPKAGQALTEAEVLAHCQQHLAGFKAPKAVVFAEALPKNPSGKLLKRELRQKHQARFSEAA
jgi:fatty-acyl-CoA synthase